MIYPPCKVDMNTMRSFSFSSYSNSPMSSQSASLISTRIPGRTLSPWMNSSGRSAKRFSFTQKSRRPTVQGSFLSGRLTSCFLILLTRSSAPPLNSSVTFMDILAAGQCSVYSLIDSSFLVHRYKTEGVTTEQIDELALMQKLKIKIEEQQIKPKALASVWNALKIIRSIKTAVPLPGALRVFTREEASVCVQSFSHMNSQAKSDQSP